MRLREESPHLEGFPPPMKPVEIANVVREKDRLGINCALQLIRVR